MAFAAKLDYCGLAETGKLEVRSATENKSNSVYAPDGEDGSTIAIEVYGLNAAPSNEYALKDDITKSAGDWQLGKVNAVGPAGSQKKYRLTSIKISTSANGPVKVTANAQLVEDGATDVSTNNYDVPALTLATKHVAQVLMSAFTHTNGNLISCDYEFAVSTSLDTLVGDIISNGVGAGKCTISGTLLVSGTSEPTITAASGFTVTKALTCTNPETAYRQFTFEIQKALTKHAVTP